MQKLIVFLVHLFIEDGTWHSPASLSLLESALLIQEAIYISAVLVVKLLLLLIV